MNQYINPRNKLFGHLDRLASLQVGEIQAPVNVEIDLSNRCSLGCEWCHFAYTHTRGPLAKDKPEGLLPGGDLMDEKLALKILDDLDSYGVRSVVWSGGGEPTLHPSFGAILTVCGERTALDQGLYTNGTYITKQNAELLKKHMKWVYVSLDAAYASSYKRRKGVDKFDVVCDAIRELVKAPGKATIGVGFLLDQDSRNHFEQMSDIGIGLGADYVQFRPVINYDPDNPSKLNGDASWINHDFWLRVYRLRQEYSDRIILDFDRFRMYRDWQGHGYYTCYWSMLQSVITPNGKVWACLNKREHPEALLGDLNVEDFRTVWERHNMEYVNDNCRVMCRGHVPNLAINEMMAIRAHSNFI